jgi:(1->4)-alpha-D-glucan 1-alpha-D-glucosylmutase
MHKATAEAKEHTSWIEPDARYDDSLRAFVTSALDDAGFVDDLGEFAARLVGPGRVNSLAQTLIKLSAPGVPDIYQGQELWDLSLVDPDNRRPVDYEARRALSAGTGTWEEARARDDAGATKLFVTRRALQTRREQAAAFDGTYDPLPATGSKADHVVAFSRGGRVITVVPRLVMGLTAGWADTSIELPDGTWTNVLTARPGHSGRLQVAHLLDDCPVALLVSTD